MPNNMIDVALLPVNIISALIIGYVAIFFLRLRKHYDYIPLDSIIIGFLILFFSFSLAASYQAIILTHVFRRASPILLGHLALQTLGLSFIAVGYVLWKSEKKVSRLRLLLYSFLLFVICLVVILIIIPLSIEEPNFETTRQYFHGANFLLLTFVAIQSFRNYVKRPQARAVTVPAAFVFLAVGQYSLFIWSLDSGLTALMFGMASRMAGFLLLLSSIIGHREHEGIAFDD